MVLALEHRSGRPGAEPEWTADVPGQGGGGGVTPHLLFFGRPVELFLLILIFLSGSQKVGGGVSAGQ